MGSNPCPPLSCIMIALISSTYSPMPYWFAYTRIMGVYASTSSLTGTYDVRPLSLPKSERAAPSSTTTRTMVMAIQLPARIALTSAFVAARIARIAFEAAAAAFFTTSTEFFAAAFARRADAFAVLTVTPGLAGIVRAVRRTVRTDRSTGFTARSAVFIDRVRFSVQTFLLSRRCFSEYGATCACVLLV